MENIIQFFDTDSYKVSQFRQYPTGATKAMSYIEARKGDETLWFGLQYIISKLEVPTIQEVELAKEFADAHFGPGIFNYEGWKSLAEMGYFPLKIKSAPEGMVIKTRNVLATVENTHPDFVWLVSWFETQLLRVWYPTTVATNSYKIKKLIHEYLVKNGTPESIGFKLHDFGSRGASSSESAGIGGAAHLVNFMGTDTLAGYMTAHKVYNGDLSSLGFSIPASEHSTITSWGRAFETEAFRNMINQFGGEGKLYACVSDSFDIWEAMQKWKDLEPLILEKGGTLVIRPDSGDPVDTPFRVVLRALTLFGYSINDAGYKVLPDHIRVIQGDGIEYDTILKILSKLDNAGISSDNIAFGMGGALLQAPNRDDLGFAMKMSGIVIDGEERDVFKDPITDPGKVSKKGFLTLVVNEDNEYETVRIRDVKEGQIEALRVVYEEGDTSKGFTNFQEVRENAEMSF